MPLEIPEWTPESRADAIDALFAHSCVLPVLRIDRIEDAVPLAKALLAGDLPVLEVTLRSDIALAAITRIREHLPDAIVGAGTVLNPDDLQAAAAAGARFAISPGASKALYAAARIAPLPFIPAIATPSELMRGIANGHRRFKFFPAEAAGGIDALTALAGPFPHVKFCPTGGIRGDRAADYLALDNVSIVGGSWMVPAGLIHSGNWQGITALARSCARLRAKVT